MHTDVVIPFLLVKDLQKSMDDFDSVILQLTQRGKLARFISSNRYTFYSSLTTTSINIYYLFNSYFNNNNDSSNNKK